MERLEVKNNYSSHECAIHMARYNFAKQFCNNKKILDISCGEGYGSYILASCGSEEVVGIDISEETINLAKKNYKLDNLKYKVSDASVLKDFKDNYFDLIVSFETIEHLSEVKKYLKEIKRVSKKDAIIIISCPNDYYYYADEESNEYHKRKYKFEEFKLLTESILGDNVKYYLGMETMGYINIQPEGIISIDNNMQVLKTNDLLETVKIAPVNEVNSDICNYYIGIWNASEIKENAVIFPYMYTDWKESSDILMNDVKNLSKLVKEEQKNYEILKGQNEVLAQENKKFIEAIEKSAKEIKKLEQLNTILYNKNQEIRKLNVNLYDENQKIFQDHKNTYNYLNAILNSKSYKLVQFFRKILRRK